MNHLARLLVAVCCAAALILAAASTASAGLITLGPPALDSTTFSKTHICTPGGEFEPGKPCFSYVQIAPAAGAIAVSPVDGVIVGWRIKGASNVSGYALRVFERSGNSFTAIGSSVAVGSLAGILTANLPIKKGQLIGVTVPESGSVAFNEEPGPIEGSFIPPIIDGTTRTPTENSRVLALNAQIQPVPTISAISPVVGAPSGGTQVTITGTDFEGASAVKFGASPAKAFAVDSESQITAFAPPGTGAVPISVTTVAGTAVSPQAFTYASGGSSGPPSADPTCTVPRLKGKTLKAAKRRIRGADCSVGKLTKKEGATARTGEVVKQVPKPGATVPVDTKVKVTLAP